MHIQVGIAILKQSACMTRDVVFGLSFRPTESSFVHSANICVHTVSQPLSIH